MKRSLSVLSLALALPAVRGIAFSGPAPTDAFAELATSGITPKPTSAPSNEELKRRQSNSDPETCGWVDGIYCMF
jgi:hypothetical protein